MNEYEKIRELIKTARQEGTQSQPWKLKADVEEVFRIFKEAGYRKPSEGKFLIEADKEAFLKLVEANKVAWGL